MPDLNDVRDELYRAAERVTGRRLSELEKEELRKAYNNQKAGTIFDKCIRAIEEVLHVDIEVVLLEKSASVDQVRNALANLKNVAARPRKK